LDCVCLSLRMSDEFVYFVDLFVFVHVNCAKVRVLMHLCSVCVYGINLYVFVECMFEFVHVF